MPQRLKLEGQRFGRLVVESYAGNSKWNVVCDCGTRKMASTQCLRGGYTKSCGCLNHDNLVKRNTTHGLSGSRTYNIWMGMRNRCNIPSATGYMSYGGRGISVCKSWDSYPQFVADMGEAPYRHSIERKDPNGNYTPENCFWLPMEKQNHNKRTTLYVNTNGTKKRLAELAQETGIPYGTLYGRLKNDEILIKDNEVIAA